MPDPVVVFKKLGTSIQLVSAGGNVVDQAGRLALRGQFCLEFAGQRSNPLTFGGGGPFAHVEPYQAHYLLLECSRIHFSWPGEVRLTDAGDSRSPWLRFRRASLQQVAGGPSAMVGLDGIAVSLVADAPDPGDDQCAFPVRTGIAKRQLVKASHPDYPNVVGYFVSTVAEGNGVRLGAFSQPAALTHAVGFELVFTTRAHLWFMLPADDEGRAPCFLAKSPQRGAIALQSVKVGAAGMVAATSPGDKRWAGLDLSIEQVRSNGGALRVEAKSGEGFHPASAWIARAVTTAAVGDATGIFCPTDRLSLSLELPLQDAITKRRPEMTLAYHHTAGKSRYERHYGVRVFGLSDRSGFPVALDASVAEFKLTGDRSAPVMHLSAGKSGWLAPKVKPGHSTRVLELAAGDLALEIEAQEQLVPSPMVLDTSQSHLLLTSPSLVAAPIGVTSKDAADFAAPIADYKRWRLTRSPASPHLKLWLTNAGLRPDAKWAESFTTSDPTQDYSAVDHPGMGICIDGGHAFLSSSSGQAVSTRFKVESGGAKETVVYSSFVAVLAYAAVRRNNEGSFAFLDPYKTLLQFEKLDDKKYVKNATAKGLQIIYFASDAGGTQGLREFIDTNRVNSDGSAADAFFWPFTMGLAVPLRRKNKAGLVEYADEIARQRLASAVPGIAFDMSTESALTPDIFGGAGSSWQALASANPVLWPRAGGQPGAQMDPSVPGWRGLAMRHLPLELAVDPDALKELPERVRDLVGTINTSLMLDYAYRDESGFTWKGGVVGLPKEGKKITPDSWDEVFQMWFHGLTVLGASGATRSASCRLEFVLPKIKNKKTAPGDVGDSLRLIGDFGLDLENEKRPVARVDVRGTKGPVSTSSIPGFESVDLKRITSNFQTVQVQVALVATDTLAQALPFLSSSKPQDAFIAFDLDGPPAGAFELSLPAEQKTKLFGRWPLTVQSMRLRWDQGDVRLEVTGRLSLGMGGFSSIGATIEIIDASGKLSFDVRLDEVGVKLSFDGVEISGMIGWGDKDPANTRVDFDQIVKPVVKDRDMRAALRVKTDGFLGDNSVLFRAGSRGEVGYWIACVEHSSKEDINLGFGKLKSPALLMAQNADLEGGGLRELAMSPQKSVFNKLRPGADSWAWLNSWKFSRDVGTVLAASGYFTVDDYLVKAPKEDEKNLSGVLWIDSGLLRIDGVAKLITEKEAEFGIAVDFRERKFMASFQTEPINFGRYTFQPGRVSLGFGFGDRKYLEVRLGWPPKVGEFDRDWTQALHFHLPEVPPPVNAGWGGFMGLWKEGVILKTGVAFRVGWMRGDGPARGGSGGGYSIGYALGGLVEFSITLNRIAELQSRVALPVPMAADALWGIANDAALQLQATDFRMEGEWFGDVWGSAWLAFMGITLASIDLKAFARYRLAGSLNNGVTDARATCGFSVSVTILCVRYSCEARYDIVVVDGGSQVSAFDEFASCPVGQIATPIEPTGSQLLLSGQPK